MILQKYFAALLSITIVVLTALLAIPTGQINGPAIVQLVAIGVAAIVTYLSPLVNIQWKGILKTGAAVLAAIISVLYPIAETHGAVSGTEVAMMVLAGLNALGVEVGVQIRTDTSTLLPVDPTPTGSVNQVIVPEDAPVTLPPIPVAPSLNTAPGATTAPVAPVWVDTTPTEAETPVTPVEPVAVATAPHPLNAVEDESAAATSTINLANLTADD